MNEYRCVILTDGSGCKVDMHTFSLLSERWWCRSSMGEAHIAYVSAISNLEEGVLP